MEKLFRFAFDHRTMFGITTLAIAYVFANIVHDADWFTIVLMSILLVYSALAFALAVLVRWR